MIHSGDERAEPNASTEAGTREKKRDQRSCRRDIELTLPPSFLSSSMFNSLVVVSVVLEVREDLVVRREDVCILWEAVPSESHAVVDAEKENRSGQLRLRRGKGVRARSPAQTAADTHTSFGRFVLRFLYRAVGGTIPG